MKSDDFIAKWDYSRCARPADTLATEKNFSDAHVVRKMIRFFRGVRAANSARLYLTKQDERDDDHEKHREEDRNDAFDHGHRLFLRVSGVPDHPRRPHHQAAGQRRHRRSGGGSPGGVGAGSSLFHPLFRVDAERPAGRFRHVLCVRHAGCVAAARQAGCHRIADGHRLCADRGGVAAGGAVRRVPSGRLAWIAP